VHVVDVDTGSALEVPATDEVLDPRIDPTGRHVAYVRAGALRCIDLASGVDHALVEPDAPAVTWGVAEFVAAEEMQRFRGYWWAPDGESMLAARVDESPVATWWIADPAHPKQEPQQVRYPAAGTANAEVSLHHVALTGDVREVAWDRTALPYLVRVSWTGDADPLLQVMSRDQRRLATLRVDVAAGTTHTVYDERATVWAEPVPGVPAWCDGAVVRVCDVHGRRRLLIGGDAVTGDDVQVRSVAGVDGDAVVFTASYDDPTQVHVVRWRAGATERITTGDGVHAVTSTSGVTVLASAALSHFGLRYDVVSPHGRHTVRSLAVEPPFEPVVRLGVVGERSLRTGLVLPRDHDGRTPLPVLMDPYGGPHAQRVLQSRRSWLDPQWLADQGFAVLVADGRGTPGRDPEWERAIRDDFVATLDDQVDALHAVAATEPALDLSRVAIRGWSFGGYLAALAVLRRPDVFHAAVAGAPVTDWSLYDTFYTERYLGDPSTQPDVYRRNSLLDDAPALSRPLLIIHGLADDNVVAAHTLQLSQRLTENGRPHAVLPLTGVTHMTPQEAVAENLLLLQVQFLRHALSADAS
jgi:dipeptidyl-peptidase-4